MANTSIYAAFERMWQHTIAALGGKSDVSHNHDDVYYTETEVDTKLTEAKDYADNAAKTALAETVRFTEQTLTEEQKDQAKSNLGIVEGASSWNDLTDKPVVFAGSDTLTWDGNTEGLACIDGFYKVSDAVLTAKDLASGGTVSIGYDTVTFSQTGIANLSDDGRTFVVSAEGDFPALAVCCEDHVGIDLGGVVFPESGLYLLNFGGGEYIASLTIPGYTGFTKEVLKPEVLPEHSHKWNDILPDTSTASDGSFLRVVDGSPMWSTLPNAEEATF